MRPPAARDREAFLAAVRESRRHLRPWVSPPADRAAFDEYLRRSRRPDAAAHLAVRRRDGALVGVFNLGRIALGNLRSAYLGYYGFATLAGQGYMTEGMEPLLRRAFTEIGLHRVEANIQPGNARSIALAERCGFRLEGYSPRYLKIGGRWRDHERWAITLEDWRTRRRARGRR